MYLWLSKLLIRQYIRTFVNLSLWLTPTSTKWMHLSNNTILQGFYKPIPSIFCTMKYVPDSVLKTLNFISSGALTITVLHSFYPGEIFMRFTNFGGFVNFPQLQCMSCRNFQKQSCPISSTL